MDRLLVKYLRETGEAVGTLGRVPHESIFDTPALVIDEAKMQHNIDEMAEAARARGVALRPHVKTHKIPAIARRQVAAGAVGITVAKVSEAEIMAEGGIGDIFIAYPLVTETKIRRAIRLSGRSRLIAGVDSLEGARLMSAVAGSEGTVLEVRLEVDSGLRRTGVPRGEAVALAEEISTLQNLDLTGIYTYRGAVLEDGSPARDLAEAGRLEGEFMVAVAEELRSSGVPMQDVSLGSTPTAEHAATVEGVTEIRPGTYVFYDRMQAQMGVCSIEECALRVMATVVSRPTPGLAVIDGGSKTFATDVQPNVAPLDLAGFGLVVGHPEAVLDRVTEEHGMLSLDEGSGLDVGDTVEIIPNHVCSTVNLHEEVYLRSRDEDVETLRVAARGMVR
jgi:D-serine deaminase-like pyridoxal phosphate-dependent protein